MIKVTDTAKDTAIRMMAEDNKVDHFIRVGVEGGGCSGLMYQLKFDNQINGGLNGKGFVFSNPNASRTCGCGESFSL